MSPEDVCKLWVALYPIFPDAYSKIRIPEEGFNAKCHQYVFLIQYDALVIISSNIFVEHECLPTLWNIRHSWLLSQSVHWTEFSLCLSFSNKSLTKTLSNNQMFQTKRYFNEIWMGTCQFTIKSNLTTVAFECCTYM